MGCSRLGLFTVDDSAYYFDPFDEKEETEWMKPGSGDGFLVWDKNGNGIIDDNTEMMSEFDEHGNKLIPKWI